MINTEFIIWCAKLILGGVASFLAILLWSKSRRGYWTSLASSIVISYIGLIFDIMNNLGVFAVDTKISFYVSLSFTVLPYLFLIIALILIIKEIF